MQAYVANVSGDHARAVMLGSGIAESGAGPALAGAALVTTGSALRHMGRHREARIHDERARDVAGSDAERLAALVGLAADAVGLAEPGDAAALAAEAAGLLRARDKRGAIRLAWVEAEVALMGDDHRAAVTASLGALAVSGSLRWRRHVAKSMLFLGASFDAARSDEADRWLVGARDEALNAGALPIAEHALALLNRRGVRVPPAGVPIPADTMERRWT